MKVVDFLKRKREILAQHPFELKDWLSPAIRDYWREFQQKAHLHPLLGRVLDLQAESQSEQQQDAATVAQVVNGQPAVAQEPAVELGAEAAELDKLSPREREILRFIARGQSNKEIARALELAESTVKIHVQNMLRKLNLSSRVQAAVYAVEKGLGGRGEG